MKHLETKVPEIKHAINLAEPNSRLDVAVTVPNLSVKMFEKEDGQENIAVITAPIRMEDTNDENDYPVVIDFVAHIIFELNDEEFKLVKDGEPKNELFKSILLIVRNELNRIAKSIMTIIGISASGDIEFGLENLVKKKPNDNDNDKDFMPDDMPLEKEIVSWWKLALNLSNECSCVCVFCLLQPLQLCWNTL